MARIEDIIQKNVSLVSLNTLRVGGTARFFAQPENQEQVQELLIWAWQQGIPVSVLGGGSNVLVSDRGFQGLVIQTGKLDQINNVIESGYFQVFAGSGVKKVTLLKLFLQHQLPCAVFLSGIPGEVGGGVVMNAGISQAVKFREFGEIVFQVQGFDLQGRFFQLDRQQLIFEYRRTKGLPAGVITQVVLSCPLQSEPQVTDQVKGYLRWRAQTQPLEWPNCGSVFKNPPGLKAAQLIDQAGLKGYTVGGAQVSHKHANFIINLGSARAQDVWDIIQHVQQVVHERYQVHLEPEVHLFGDW